MNSILSKKKKVQLFQYLFTLVIICCLLLSFSKNPIEQAPLNPAYIKYQKKIQQGFSVSNSFSGYALGEIPSPVDLSHVRIDQKKGIDLSFPDTYDLRDHNKLTPIKDQGGCGSCWTFATYGSLESYLMPPELKDFSEQDMNANHGFDWAECDGGNSFMSTAYLTRWSGPLDETDIPYPYTASEGNGYALQKHIQQVIFLPDRVDALDNDIIKDFVINYGAVYISMRWDSSYHNYSTDSYYYNGSSSTNHAVAVVGWDDNYDKNNFNYIPSENGAFIVRNSWGTDFGENGYFFLSYYDSALTPKASFNNAEPTSNYAHIYQYDPLGWTNTIGYGDTTAWGANIFSSYISQNLQAISFYTTDANVNISITVYSAVSGNTDPTNGNLETSQTESFTYPGYYTILLDSPVSLSAEENFSIVIEFQNSSYNYPLALEDDIFEYSSNASANTGESFVSATGTSWYDIGNGWNANVCIKGFTVSGGIEQYTLSISTSTGGTTDPEPGTYQYDNGTQVEISVISDPGYDFTHWTGDIAPGSKNDNPLTITMDSDKAITADFDYKTWYKINTRSPFKLICGNLDSNAQEEIIADFVSIGLWAYDNNTIWRKIHPDNATALACGDLDQRGYNDVVAGFAGIGIWIYENGTIWNKINSHNPESLVCGDLDSNSKEEVIADFDSIGLWSYDNFDTWRRLNQNNASIITCGDIDGNGQDDVIAGFGSGGLWVYKNNLIWEKINIKIPDKLTCGDLDGNGQDEVIAQFSSIGLWSYDNDAMWRKLNNNNASSLSCEDTDGNSQDDLAAYFSSLGLWVYKNNTTWEKINNNNPLTISSGDLAGDNRAKVIAGFSSLGLWIYSDIDN